MIRMLFTGRRLWVTLLVVLGAAIMCRLGVWQLDRLAQRRAINAAINTNMTAPPVALNDAGDLPPEYRRVTARGVYDPSQEIVLRNHPLDGAPGVHVLTPLRLSGSDRAVLVDRGWLPMDRAKPEERRAFAPPAGEVTVEGVARRSQADAPGPAESPADPTTGRRDAWFRVDIPQIARQAGYPLLPLFIQQQPAPGVPNAATLPRPVATTDLGEGPHLSYAVQWFSFALITIAGYLALTRQQLRQKELVQLS